MGRCKSTKQLQIPQAVSTGMLESTLCAIGAQADFLVYRSASDVVASAKQLYRSDKVGMLHPCMSQTCTGALHLEFPRV